MDEREWLTERFVQHRGHLRAVAYRMLGSVSEAEDALQETWLRIRDEDPASVENMQAWLTTIVGRVCLNALRSRSARREDRVDFHVPDPVVTFREDLDPEQEALLADSVGLALLVVLDALTPAERLAFVLHDVFKVPFADIAALLDRSEPAAQQLASRARRRVQGAPRAGRRSHAAARRGFRVPCSFARRRFRRAAGGARPQRGAPHRRRAASRGRVARAAGCRIGLTPHLDLRPASPVRQASARERSRGRGCGHARNIVLSNGLHHNRGTDHPDRRPA
jgi:RNA polymerase sigma factor (sigma-70 family)